MKLIIASNNAHKLEEIRAILGAYFDDILSLKQAGISHETVEDGTTFFENAEKKAREIAEIAGCYALADDSGLCVNALGGAPGIYSARYAGEHGNDGGNIELLLKNLQGIEDRSAYFCSCIVLCAPDGSIFAQAEGRFYGKIAYEKAGDNGFGYDPIFYLDEYGKTVAQLPADVKNAISHRAKALKQLETIIKEVHDA